MVGKTNYDIVGNSRALRERLHEKLDQILNTRAKIEQSRRTGIFEQDDLSRRSRVLFQQIVRCADECFGRDARNFAFENAGWVEFDPQVQFGLKLKLATALIDGNPKGLRRSKPAPHSAEEAAKELAAMQYGDRPELFAAKTAARGQLPNASKLIPLKSRALAWDVALKEDFEGGHSDEEWMASAGGRQNVISEAYGERWDTIRKWDRAIKKFHKMKKPDDFDYHLRRSVKDLRNVRSYGVTLEQDGARYRAELERPR